MHAKPRDSTQSRAVHCAPLPFQTLAQLRQLATRCSLMAHNAHSWRQLNFVSLKSRQIKEALSLIDLKF